jgi:hypothetical protein
MKTASNTPLTRTPSTQSASIAHWKRPLLTGHTDCLRHQAFQHCSPSTRRSPFDRPRRRRSRDPLSTVNHVDEPMNDHRRLRNPLATDSSQTANQSSATLSSSTTSLAHQKERLLWTAGAVSSAVGNHLNGKDSTWFNKRNAANAITVHIE